MIPGTPAHLDPRPLRPLPPVAKPAPRNNYRPAELCELLAARPDLAGICDRVDVVAGVGGWGV